MKSRVDRPRFWLGALAGYLQIATLLVGNVLAVALIVRQLGPDASATWALLYGVMSAIEMTAFGLGLSLVNGMARADDVAPRWAVLTKLVRRAVALATGLALVVLLAAPLLRGPVLELFGSAADVVPGFGGAVVACLALALGKAPGYLATFAFAGTHEIHLTRAYQAAYAVAPAIGAALAASFDIGFWGFFALVQAWQVGTLAILVAHVLARRPRTPVPDLAGATGWQPVRYGVVLASNQLVIMSGGFVVAGIASARAVLAYVLLWRIVSVLVTLVNVVPSTLWSRMAALASTGPEESRLIGRLTLATTLIASCAGIVLVWTGDWLVLAWAGPGLYAGPGIAMFLSLYLVGQGVGLTALNLAVARELAWRDVIGMAGYAILHTLLAVVLGQRFGIAGVAGGAAVVTMVCYALFATTIPQRLGFARENLGLRAVGLQVAAAVVALLSMLAVTTSFESAMQRVPFGAAVVLAWAVAAWLLVPREERDWLTGLVLVRAR
jgi:hypothetical protein